ncbi:hypothetical protein DPEC_G00362360 [Dallia pectoralis]|nr:hypothetical protein DPEC_G00362360 [Dallia pectoralis]
MPLFVAFLFQYKLSVCGYINTLRVLFSALIMCFKTCIEWPGGHLFKHSKECLPLSECLSSNPWL